MSSDCDFNEGSKFFRAGLLGSLNSVGDGK